MEKQWDALGALADRVLREAAGARALSVGQLRDAEAEHGTVAYERRGSQPSARLQSRERVVPRQLELPLA